MKKFAELMNQTPDELREKMDTLRKELFDARFKKATHQLEDTAVFRRKRHEIAQLETALRRKQLESQSKGEKAHA